jgi:hypothetical protein
MKKIAILRKNQTAAAEKNAYIYVMARLYA